MMAYAMTYKGVSFPCFTYSYRNTAFSQSKLTFSKCYFIIIGQTRERESVFDMITYPNLRLGIDFLGVFIMELLNYVYTLRLIRTIWYPGECDLVVPPRKYGVILSRIHFVTFVRI